MSNNINHFASNTPMMQTLGSPDLLILSLISVNQRVFLCVCAGHCFLMGHNIGSLGTKLVSLGSW